MSKKLFFNWKMNPSTWSDASNLFENLQQACSQNPKAFVVACPPSVYLQSLVTQQTTKQFPALGAQDISTQQSGAMTGELSGQMLRDLGVTYTIIGHSETRKLHGLTNQTINKKVQQALANNLTPILCIGYEAQPGGEEINYTELAEQIQVGLQDITPNSTIYLAYEPVWAIGTGKTASNETIQQVNEFILTELAKLNLQDRVEILYGGSVDDQSLPELSTIESVSGFLIGGASLKPEKFSEMIGFSS
jgi:triosephosphate isomerase